MPLVTDQELPAQNARPPEPPATLVVDQRRRAAKQRVAAAVLRAAERVMVGQVRFEVAYEAKNGRIDSIAMLEDEAKTKGLSVQVLSDQIVHERRGRERRMMLVYPVEERAYTDIDAATGDAIDAIAAAAASEINHGE